MSERTPARVEQERIVLEKGYLEARANLALKHGRHWTAAAYSYIDGSVAGNSSQGTEAPLPIKAAVKNILRLEEMHKPGIKNHVKNNLGAYQELAAADARMQRVTGLTLDYELVERSDADAKVGIGYELPRTKLDAVRLIKIGAAALKEASEGTDYNLAFANKAHDKNSREFLRGVRTVATDIWNTECMTIKGAAGTLLVPNANIDGYMPLELCVAGAFDEARDAGMLFAEAVREPGPDFSERVDAAIDTYNTIMESN